MVICKGLFVGGQAERTTEMVVPTVEVLRGVVTVVLTVEVLRGVVTVAPIVDGFRDMFVIAFGEPGYP